MMFYCPNHSHISKPPWAKEDCLQSVEDMMVVFTIAPIPSKNSVTLEFSLGKEIRT